MSSITALLLVVMLQTAMSILLCDSDCIGNTQLEICQKTLANKNKTLLPVMAFFPCNTENFRARGLTVAAQMAAKRVAKDDTILDGYKLQLEVVNTMCSSLAIRSFIDQLSLVNQNESRYMIIGPGCSGGATPIAEIAPFYSLTQIGYTTTSVSLSDQTQFPNFIRSISSDNASVATVTALVRRFGWRKVAIVNTLDALFTNLTSVQKAALEAESLPDRRIEVETFSFADPPGDNNTERARIVEGIITSVQESGSRVVLLNTGESIGRFVFCLAYQRNMTYPEYTFISHYWWSEFWWFDGENQTDCSVAQLTTAIYRSLAVDHFPEPRGEQRDLPTDVGYESPDAFWTDFLFNLRALDYLESEALRQAFFVYDAVWVAALALNNASLEIRNEAVDGVTSLEEFNQFTDPERAGQINNLILRAARNIKFMGVSGQVSLNEFGDREPVRRVFQYLYEPNTVPNRSTNNDLLFAKVGDQGQLVFINNQSVDSVFPPEEGGVTVDVELISISLALFIVYTFLAVLGILFSVACIVFNLVFRNKRIVKLSSPYLNLLIISGGILLYVAVIMFGLDTGFVSFEVVSILRCHFTGWLSSIGFSLLFGTMLAKTWRVYYIFRNIRLKKRPLKDWMLFLIVCVMVALDVVFLTVVSVDLFRMRLVPLPLINRVGQVPNLFNSCSSAASSIWLPILLAYKGLYLLVGVFLAIQTYNVKLKRLRDSKLIVACVCTIAVIALVASIVGLTVTNMPSVSYGLYGAFILIGVTVILFILFGTRMIELYKNPSGEIEVSTVGNGVDTSKYSTSSDEQARVDQLKNTIKSLKQEIEKKKRETMEFADPHPLPLSVSPAHSDTLNSSSVNLLRHHVTPFPDHMTEGALNNEQIISSVSIVVNAHSEFHNLKPLDNGNCDGDNEDSLEEAAL